MRAELLWSRNPRLFYKPTLSLEQNRISDSQNLVFWCGSWMFTQIPYVQLIMADLWEVEAPLGVRKKKEAVPPWLMKLSLYGKCSEWREPLSRAEQSNLALQQTTGDHTTEHGSCRKFWGFCVYYSLFSCNFIYLLIKGFFFFL